jgi:hypothetical protein
MPCRTCSRTWTNGRPQIADGEEQVPFNPGMITPLATLDTTLAGEAASLYAS